MSTLHRTFINYREEGADKQEFKLPSQTQPDELMSIREMLIRHSRGLAVPGINTRTPFFSEDHDVPDPRSLDLTEIQEQQERYRQLVDKIDKDLRTPKNPPPPPTPPAPPIPPAPPTPPVDPSKPQP